MQSVDNQYIAPPPQGNDTIIDYVSGREVRATPEEIQAVQPFSRILVEDYGYKKSNLVTHPQYRVKTRPSDKKGYPMDITVFEEGHIKMIVECKKLEEKLDSGMRNSCSYTCRFPELR